VSQETNDPRSSVKSISSAAVKRGVRAGGRFDETAKAD
jgi:hypothetical protein